MQFKPLIDLESFKDENERNKYIDELKRESILCSQTEQATKLTLNAIYGALGNQYFHWLNYNIAEAITLGGQHAIKQTNKFVMDWVNNLKFNQKVLNEFNKTTINTDFLSETESCTVYSDTDSFLFGKIPILRNKTDDIIKVEISDLFDECLLHGKLNITTTGHEWVYGNDYVINYDHKLKKLVLSKIKRLIRHKVSKSKYRIRSVNGNEIIVTGDHSLIVIRENEKIAIKAKDIRKTDLLIELKDKLE